MTITYSKLLKGYIVYVPSKYSPTGTSMICVKPKRTQAIMSAFKRLKYIKQ